MQQVRGLHTGSYWKWDMSIKSAGGTCGNGKVLNMLNVPFFCYQQLMCRFFGPAQARPASVTKLDCRNLVSCAEPMA